VLRLLAVLSDSTMLLPVQIALRVVAAEADEVVAEVVSEIEDVGAEAVDEEVVVAVLVIEDEVDPEVVAVVSRQTEEVSETSRARSRLSKSRGIA